MILKLKSSPSHIPLLLLSLFCLVAYTCPVMAGSNLTIPQSELGVRTTDDIVPNITSFTINSGATIANYKNVTLNNACANSPTQYMASESSVFAGAAWQTYSTSPAFLLTSGNGVKTIYFKVSNAAGESVVVSSNITLNEFIPALGQAVDNTTLTFTTNGAAPWTSQTATSFYGGSAAQSGHIVYGQESTMQTTVVGPGTLKFYSKVSSLASYDYLRFYVDGYEQTGSISGEIDWAQKIYSLGVGSHTLIWRYGKGSSQSAGSDCGWVDKIEWSTFNSVPTVTSFAINNGDTTATSLTVLLNNTCLESPSQYMASESSVFTGASWQAYSAAPSFMLSSGNGTKTVHFRVKNALGVSLVVSDTIALNLPVIGLNQAVDNTTLTFTTGGTANWFGQSINSYFGGSSAQSGDVADSQESWIQTTVSGPGTLTYYWKVSSESGYDYLRFLIDSVEQTGSISGTVDWMQKTFNIASGNHTLRWRYSKDNVYSSGLDCGWIDKIVWTPIIVVPSVTSLSIDNGAANTLNSTVTLNNVCNGNPTQYMASESSSFTGAIWQAWSAAPVFSLSAGDGLKTVYFKVKGSAGESSSATDTITRGRIVPSNPNPGDGATAVPVTSRLSWSGGANCSAILDDFEDGNIAEYTKLGGTSAVATAAAHDGVYGLSSNGGWMYRDDPTVHVAQGDTISWWVKPQYSSGRTYCGFGASSAGTYSLVLGPTTGAFIIQRNVAYDYLIIGSAAQMWTMGKWYRVEAKWSVGGGIVGNLFDSDGITLLNTVSASDNTYTAGGLAFRDFDGLPSCIDTIQLNQAQAASGSYFEVFFGESGSPMNRITTTTLQNCAPVPYPLAYAKSYSWKVVAKDSSGSVSSPVWTFSTLLAPAPVVNSFAINNGAATAGSRTVTLDNTCINNPTHYMASESSTFVGASWQAWAASPTFVLSSGNGAKTVYFKVKNAGSESSFVTDSITLSEVMPPEVSALNINGGAVSSSNRTVTLNNYCTNSPTHYMASETPGLTTGTWLTYSTAPNFTLSSGNGLKTVYFKVKNAGGESSVTLDSITLNIILIPTISSFSINNGDASTSNQIVTLDNVCKNSPTQYMASESSSFTGAAWQNWSSSPNFTLSAGSGTKTVYFKVANSAGGSATMSDTIAFNEVKIPSVTAFTINSGADVVTTRTVTLNNTCANNPTEYMASEAMNFAGGTWQAWSAAPKFTLSAENGLKAVYFKVRNSAGESSSVSHSITLKMPPSISSFRINNGAILTSNRTVMLNNICINNPTQYMASESSTFSDAVWQLWSVSPQFTLSDGYGMKTVYFKVKSAEGESSVASNRITRCKACGAEASWIFY